MTIHRSILLAAVAVSSLLAIHASARAPDASPVKDTSPSAPSTADAKPAGAPPPSITYGGGDGSSCDKAIVIQNAKDEAAGVHSEYVWLREHFPGAKMISQAEVNGKGKNYDQLDYTDQDGAKHSTCFDITGFFGKF